MSWVELKKSVPPWQYLGSEPSRRSEHLKQISKTEMSFEC